MRFIQLTEVFADYHPPVWINAAAIVYMHRDAGKTTISFGGQHSWNIEVTEHPDVIVDKIERP